jgi:hypothetical protein
MALDATGGTSMQFGTTWKTGTRDRHFCEKSGAGPNSPQFSTNSCRSLEVQADFTRILE